MAHVLPAPPHTAGKRGKSARKQGSRATAYVTALLLAAAPPLPAQGIAVSNSQQAAALDYLQALASNDPTLHPDDLKALRLRILTLLHQEAKKGERARCCSRRCASCARWYVAE